MFVDVKPGQHPFRKRIGPLENKRVLEVKIQSLFPSQVLKPVSLFLIVIFIFWASFFEE